MLNKQQLREISSECRRDMLYYSGKNFAPDRRAEKAAADHRRNRRQVEPIRVEREAFVETVQPKHVVKHVTSRQSSVSSVVFANGGARRLYF